MLVLAALAAVMLLALPAASHPLTDTSLDAGAWLAFRPDPLVVAPVLLVAALQVRGVLVLRRRGARGSAVSLWRSALFLLGLVAVLLALASPVDALAAQLLSAHMLQHVLLVAAAAPLLAIGMPSLPLLFALPRPWRGALARRLGRPLGAAWRLATRVEVAFALHLAALLAWHVPRFYEAALVDEGLHALEHVSMLGTGVLFWRSLVTAGRGGPARRGLTVLLVFVTSTAGALLGALLTFAASPWYALHAAGARAFDLDPLADQQLAGLIMWVPCGLLYAIAALATFVTWLLEIERGAPKAPFVCLLAGALLGAAGCREERAPPAALEGIGEAGAFRFSLAPSPEEPEVHELFSVVTTLREAATDAPVEGAALELDATMPEHGHGMITAPRTRELGGGRYLTEGMKLHMHGAWRLEVRATKGARSDLLALPWQQPPRRAAR